MAEWAECDRQMANFLPIRKRPLILAQMLCSRRIAEFSLSLEAAHSYKKTYIGEDL